MSEGTEGNFEGFERGKKEQRKGEGKKGGNEDTTTKGFEGFLEEKRVSTEVKIGKRKGKLRVTQVQKMGKEGKDEESMG